MTSDAENSEMEMTIVGMIRMNMSIPTFGTPILQSNDGSGVLYIQSSRKDSNIEEFIKVPPAVTQREDYVSLRYNTTIKTGDSFWTGFCDYEKYCFCIEKDALKIIIDKDFELYEYLPFLQWTMCYFYRSDEWLHRMPDKSLDLIFEALIVVPYWPEIIATAAMRSVRLSIDQVRYDIDRDQPIPLEIEKYFKIHMDKYIKTMNNALTEKNLSKNNENKILRRVWINYKHDIKNSNAKIEQFLEIFMSVNRNNAVIDRDSKRRFLSKYMIWS